MIAQMNVKDLIPNLIEFVIGDSFGKYTDGEKKAVILVFEVEVGEFKRVFNYLVTQNNEVFLSEGYYKFSTDMLGEFKFVTKHSSCWRRAFHHIEGWAIATLRNHYPENNYKGNVHTGCRFLNVGGDSGIIRCKVKTEPIVDEYNDFMVTSISY